MPMFMKALQDALRDVYRRKIVFFFSDFEIQNSMKETK
jgi:hypothetical protein